LKTRNLLIFRDAKIRKKRKIAPNWNVLEREIFHLPNKFKVTAFHCFEYHSGNQLRGRSHVRNIKPLFNFDPPVTPEEVRAASLQFVRKITGFQQTVEDQRRAFQAAIEKSQKYQGV